MWKIGCLFARVGLWIFLAGAILISGQIFIDRIQHLQQTDSPQESHIVRTLRRVDKETSLLREQFTRLLEPVAVAPSDAQKLLALDCKESCMSGRYWEPVVTGFLLSVIEQRGFIIFSDKDCGLEYVYQEGGVEWIPNHASIHPGFMLDRMVPLAKDVYTQNSELLRAERLVLNNDGLLNPGSHMLLLEHMINWIVSIRQNERALSRMPWLVGLSTNDVFRMIHVGLFKLPRHLHTEIQTTLKKQVGNSKLLCYYGDQKTPNHKVFTFIKLLNSNSDYVTYLNEPSTIPTELEAFEYLDLDQLISETVINNQKKCDTHVQNMITTAVARTCDVLITSNNPVGLLGAILRGHSDDLYCVNRFGEVYACIRSEITSSFRDNLHQSINSVHFARIMNIKPDKNGIVTIA